VIFVPVALNYDQVLEDRFLIKADKGGNRRFRPPLMDVVRAVSHHFWLRLTGRFKGFGVASVGFGTPLELSAFAASTQGDLTDALAQELMQRIQNVVPVLAVPLVARGLAQDRITDRGILIDQLAAQLKALKSRKIPKPRRSADEIVSDSLRRFSERGLITLTGDHIAITPQGQDVLAYYAASIEHHFDPAPGPLMALPGNEAEGAAMQKT